MAFDTLSERPIPIENLPVRYPEHVPGRGGQPVHPCTISLWHRRGVRGVRLETLMIGGRRCTSLEALARFHAAVSQATDLHQKRPAASNPRTSREQARAVRAAVQALQKAGC